MVVVGRLDQKMPGPIFCPSPAADNPFEIFNLIYFNIFYIYSGFKFRFLGKKDLFLCETSVH